MSDAFHAAEGGRRTTNLVLVGVVESIDRDAGTVRVTFEDDWTSADLRWAEAGAGAFRTRRDPSIGEQLLVFCPSGDPAQGVVAGRVPCDAFPLPEAEEGETVLGVWDDGARDSYKAETHLREISLPEGGQYLVIIGGTQIEASDERIALKVGASELVITEGSILLKATSVDLGGTGGQPVGRVNDAITTSPPRIAAGSSKVKAV